MIILCERCGKKGSLDEQSYLGKKLRLRCPYCSHDFVFAVPVNGNQVPLASASEPEDAEPSLQEPTPSVGGEVPEATILEAKRIARLIVSEIKLYNQERIARAGSAREVMDLLWHDLMRGKQHYDNRVGAKLPLGQDYFMETVREILLAGKT